MAVPTTVSTCWNSFTNNEKNPDKLLRSKPTQNSSAKRCFRNESVWRSVPSRGLLLSLLVCSQITASYAQLPTKEEQDRCSPNKTDEPRVCSRGVILPLWQPGDTSLLTTADTAGRAIVFFIVLVYLFLGVSIIADRFMASIEVITSKEKEITYKTKSGEKDTTTVRIWNETVSNLTLMALGSSAPEIMLSVIEICGKKFYAGDLGPSTIVGSASFNLFVIIAICMYVIPDGEVRRIKHPRVFFVTATWSILAYVWLYVILAVSSPGVVEIWEGVITFLFFPILVVIAWIADRRLLVYKYMHKRYRTRHRKVIVETEGGPKYDEDGDIHLTELGENGKTDDGALSRDSNVTYAETVDDVTDPETSRKNMVKLMRELRKEHPDADMAELARLASARTISHQHKSRAFYRIQAIRKMTGAGNVLNKGKLDQMKATDSELTVEEKDESVAKIFFDPADYRVLENCGLAELKVSRRGGDLNTTLYVDYRTVDGTANAGSDFEFKEDTIRFDPGETVKSINVTILDDDVFEEDEYFSVELYNVRSGSTDGMFDTDVNSAKIARLDAPSVAHVIILDDDHAGVFTFASEAVTVNEGVGVLKVEVQRNSGARGTVAVPYRTVSGSAKGGGVDYVDAFGELLFENDQSVNHVHIQIVDDEEYEKNKSFFLELSTPRQIQDETIAEEAGETGKEKATLETLTEEDEEDKRIAELGKARLGEYKSIEIMIEESYEFKNTVDKLIKKANLAVMVSTSSWREQFSEALSVNGVVTQRKQSSEEPDQPKTDKSPKRGTITAAYPFLSMLIKIVLLADAAAQWALGDDDEGEESVPSAFDYIMHYLTVLWKLLFAFVPPSELAGGWPCFAVSIIMIGLLTAVIGDVASQFGCIVDLNDAVTAITLVAMGTSVPDTFASKVAAVGDQYADASIGNVTGSNAVNVFLGIGIAWTIAAIYWAVAGRNAQEKQFRVPPGNLAFSVTVFSIFAFVAVAVLMFRRKSKSIGAELGGPRTPKIISALIFVSLWLIYILLAALDSYCIIKTF